MLLALAVGCANASRFRGAICDDAVISFRSVENFALGHGLVYNLGERLETFTNLGLVVLLVIARTLGIDPFDAATAIGFTAAIATVGATWRLARELDLGGAVAVPALFVALSTTLMGQAGSGLETTLCALFVTLGVARSLEECRPRDDGRARRHGVGVLLLTLAAVTRPDAACVLFGMAVCKPFLLAASERRRALVVDAVVAALLLGAVVVFRLAYYGALLPNPVHAKVGLGDPQAWKSGFSYVFDWLRTDFGLGVLVAGLALAASTNGRARALVVLCAGWCFYVVVSGGDHMAYSRFFAPMLAVFAVVITAGFAPLFAGGGRWRVFAGVAFAAAVAIVPVWLSVSNGNVPAKNMAHETYRREIGEWFATEASARGGRLVVACNPVGYIGFFGGPGVRVVDMLGLCSSHIANNGRRDPRLLAGHQVGDGAWVLAQQPDYVILGTVTVRDPWQRQDAATLLSEVRAAGVEAWAKANDHQFLVSEREMLASEELVRDYAFVSVALPSGRVFHVMKRAG